MIFAILQPCKINILCHLNRNHIPIDARRRELSKRDITSIVQNLRKGLFLVQAICEGLKEGATSCSGRHPQGMAKPDVDPIKTPQRRTRKQ